MSCVEQKAGTIRSTTFDFSVASHGWPGKLTSICGAIAARKDNPSPRLLSISFPTLRRQSRGHTNKSLRGLLRACPMRLTRLGCSQARPPIAHCATRYKQNSLARPQVRPRRSRTAIRTFGRFFQRGTPSSPARRDLFRTDWGTLRAHNRGTIPRVFSRGRLRDPAR